MFLIGNDVVEYGSGVTVECVQQHRVLSVTEVISVQVFPVGIDEISLAGGYAEQTCLIESGGRRWYLVAFAFGGYSALATDGIRVDVSFAVCGVLQDSSRLSAAIQRVYAGYECQSVWREVFLRIPAESFLRIRIGQIVHRCTHRTKVAEYTVACVEHYILLNGGSRVILASMIAGNASRWGKVIIAFVLQIVAYGVAELAFVEAA